MFYPWTYLLPGGNLFIAGPQGVTRRFDWIATPITYTPLNTWNTNGGDRGALGSSMNGSSLLLPLRPPNHLPRILILGGEVPGTELSAEMIDLSAAVPAWTNLPNLNYGRNNANAVLLPDGRVWIVGGMSSAPGPVEIYDPANPGAGWVPGPSMLHPRTYHSAAILLPDGSILMGGDPPGPMGLTPHEWFFPDYCFKARPVSTKAPTSIAYGSMFTIQTPNGPGITEVLLLRPGAVTHGFNMSQRYVGCVITGTGAASVQAQAGAPSGGGDARRGGGAAPPLERVVDHPRRAAERLGDPLRLQSLLHVESPQTLVRGDPSELGPAWIDLRPGLPRGVS